MVWLIDGYNLVFHQDWPYPTGPLEHQRESLLTVLKRYRHCLGKSRLIVVFDGAAKVSAPSYQQEEGLEVYYYQGPGGADTQIRRLARRFPSVMVVTSDRELANAVRRSGAQICSAEDFIACLPRGIASLAWKAAGDEDDRQSEKPSRISSDEVAQWLDLFGLEEDINF